MRRTTIIKGVAWAVAAALFMSGVALAGRKAAGAAARGQKAALAAGTLSASGKGRVALRFREGRLTLSGKGGLWISQGAEAKVEGYKETKPQSIKDHPGTLYVGFDGQARVSGKQFAVILRGEKIELTAEGVGAARLRGEGTYTVTVGAGQPVNGQWTADGVTVRF